MRKLILAGALMLPLAACETTHTPTVPTALESNGNLSVTATLSNPAQQGSMVSCPAVPPFAATVNVVVVAGSVNVFVTSITSQFVDRNGVPSVTLPAPIPTAQFGSALVAARSSVLFPVDVRFGCGTVGNGTLFMTVRLTDANGAAFSRDVRVSVN